MADAQTKNILGVVDKREVQSSNANPYSSGIIGGTGRDIAAMKARLTAIGGVYANTTYQNQMTLNDMIFAIRINDEAAGLNW